ncbi:MAG: Crp/Fnr family transcriptional regulator [Pseudomonadota bacterium]
MAKDARLLDFLSDPLRDKLAELWHQRPVEKDRVIVETGQDSTEVFFILAGSFFAYNVTEGGREVVYDRFEPGDCIGEFSAIDGAARSTDVKALTDGKLAVLAARDFRDLFRRQPDFAEAVARYLVAKLRTSVESFTHLKTETVEHRIMRRLCAIAAEHREAEGDRVFIPRPPTQETIARETNAYREAVVNVMSKLRDEGLLERKGRAVIIPSLRRLTARLEQE